MMGTPAARERRLERPGNEANHRPAPGRPLAAFLEARPESQKVINKKRREHFICLAIGKLDPKSFGLCSDIDPEDFTFGNTCAEAPVVFFFCVCFRLGFYFIFHFYLLGPTKKKRKEKKRKRKKKKNIGGLGRIAESRLSESKTKCSNAMEMEKLRKCRVTTHSLGCSFHS